jgi:hypothetical protein
MNPSMTAILRTCVHAAAWALARLLAPSSLLMAADALRLFVLTDIGKRVRPEADPGATFEVGESRRQSPQVFQTCDGLTGTRPLRRCSAPNWRGVVPFSARN